MNFLEIKTKNEEKSKNGNEKNEKTVKVGNSYTIEGKCYEVAELNGDEVVVSTQLFPMMDWCGSISLTEFLKLI